MNVSDLFHQVIPMAGNAACDWAISDKVEASSKAWARKLECPTDDSKVMIECMRSKPMEKFERGLEFKTFDPSKAGLEFGPRIDGDFLPKPVIELRKEAPKKKCLIGTAEVEGLLFGIDCEISRFPFLKCSQMMTHYCSCIWTESHIDRWLRFTDRQYHHRTTISD